MSDQQSQPTSGETGTLGAAPAVPAMPASSEPVTAAAEVEAAARPAPDQEETSPKADTPKVDAVSMEAPKVEASKTEAPKIEAPKIDAVKPEAPRFPGNVTIMSPGDRVGADTKAAAGSSGKRRFGAMAAVVALATVAGALGGALATAGVGKLIGGDSTQASVKDTALETSVARLDAEIVELKASLEHNSKTTTGQINKASDRLDKVEKAQAEPAAKLAKLSETVDKLRAAQHDDGCCRAGRRKGHYWLDTAAGCRRNAACLQHKRRRPSLRWPGCRPSTAGYCGTSPMAAP